MSLPTSNHRNETVSNGVYELTNTGHKKNDSPKISSRCVLPKRALENYPTTGIVKPFLVNLVQK
jgi:hypothetical protein